MGSKGLVLHQKIAYEERTENLHQQVCDMSQAVNQD
jgi:hypothetical protein